MERFVDRDEWFSHEVENGLTAATGGALLSHEARCALFVGKIERD